MECINWRNKHLESQSYVNVLRHLFVGKMFCQRLFQRKSSIYKHIFVQSKNISTGCFKALGRRNEARAILKRYRGTARYEKGFKGSRRKVSPELDSWLNSDQFWLQAHFCSSKDKEVRIISVKAKIPLPSCKSYYLAMKSIDIITIFSLQK